MGVDKQYKFIKEAIEKYGLKPASRREVSLFCWSCLALGYTKLLKKQIGFSYNALGVLGRRDGTGHTMFNEKHIADSTEKYIARNFRKLDKVFFVPAKTSFKRIKKQIEKIEKEINKDYRENLGIIAKIYPDYFKVLAMYNCFLRYLGNKESKGRISLKYAKKIAKERETVARLYPRIEKLIKRSVQLVGMKSKFNKDLLRYLTRNEMYDYLKNRKISKKLLEDLSKRKKESFYLFVEKGNKEYVFTDRNLLKRIENDFFGIRQKEIVQIKGYPVYKGKARGFVYNFHSSKKRPKKDFILVISMTYPKDIALVKQCQAIITDEGGILSHAAIISRELKKPCIIGTKIATKVLQDRQLVEIDANKGIIKILKRRN